MKTHPIIERFEDAVSHVDSNYNIAPECPRSKFSVSGDELEGFYETEQTFAFMDYGLRVRLVFNEVDESLRPDNVVSYDNMRDREIYDNGIYEGIKHTEHNMLDDDIITVPDWIGEPSSPSALGALDNIGKIDETVTVLQWLHQFTVEIIGWDEDTFVISELKTKLYKDATYVSIMLGP